MDFEVFKDGKVTILILIDGFLQFRHLHLYVAHKNSHNPYFNRWFSAIITTNHFKNQLTSHNPYFNRWFSAIFNNQDVFYSKRMSQSLF